MTPVRVMTRPIPFHPMLFATFPILFAVAHNPDRVAIQQALLPLAAAVVVSGMLWGLVAWGARNAERAALVTSLWLAAFFSYGHAYNLVMNSTLWGVIIGRHRFIFPAWIALALLGSWWLLTTRRMLQPGTRVANVIGAILMLLSGVPIVTAGIRGGNSAAAHPQPLAAAVQAAALRSPGTLPDIYYIILDGYGSAQTLQELFGYDNRKLLDALMARGFYIASDSRCNYDQSITSITSSLNLTLLDDTQATTWPLLTEMIQNHALMRSLKGLGYRYLHISSGEWEPTAENPHADRLYRNTLWESELNSLLMDTTLLKPFVLWGGERRRAAIVFSLATLTKIPALAEPTITFAHVLSPHPPYVFDRQGGQLIRSLDMTRWEPRERYLDQVIALNHRLIPVIDALLSQSATPPIIILQGDHGPKFLNTNVEHKTRILNAFYVPEHVRRALYPAISPANSFRVVFNQLFEASLPLVPDGYQPARARFGFNEFD